MKKTRIARQARAALSAYEAQVAERTRAVELAAALAARTAPGIAPIEPHALMALFAADADLAYATLAGLTRAQRVNEAIEVAMWLEGADIGVAWLAVLDRWEARCAARGLELAA
ncbi:MAG TPA: hypothetical protein PKD53_00545 [Chloroflexaceae bacterium]|nr:hypothetical protein [Chloroflexaceae bacterium]